MSRLLGSGAYSTSMEGIIVGGMFLEAGLGKMF